MRNDISVMAIKNIYLSVIYDIFLSCIRTRVFETTEIIWLNKNLSQESFCPCGRVFLTASENQQIDVFSTYKISLQSRAIILGLADFLKFNLQISESIIESIEFGNESICDVGPIDLSTIDLQTTK